MDKLTSWRLGLTPGQMREVDRQAEADYGITPLQLMEVAGLQTARVAREIFGPLAGRAVCILAGKGNNGADGLVAARRLAGWGARVRVITSFAPADAAGLVAVQLRPLAREGIRVEAWAGALPGADLYVDALLGFGSEGAPRGVVGEIIAASPQGASTLAVDVPSGLDAETGAAAATCISAGATVTLAVPKTGLVAARAMEGDHQRVGTLYVADIGVPRELLRGLGIDTTGLFELADIQLVSR